MNDVWRVVSKDGKRLFEGLENDARDFLARNFPRLHVEPHSDSTGKPDAVLVGPGKNVETGEYHSNGEFANVADLNTESETQPAAEDDWQAKAKAAGWTVPESTPESESDNGNA